MIPKVLYLLMFAMALVVMIAIVMIIKERVNEFMAIAAKHEMRRKIISLNREGKSNDEIANKLEAR